MKQITFDEMLRANGLPPVGEILTTPAGDKVEVIAYVYDVYEDIVRVRLHWNDYVIDWTHDQTRECTWEGKDETVSN